MNKQKIIEIEKLNHNVVRIRVEKPENYNFVSGQHTMLSFTGKDGEKRSFSINSIPSDEFLEFRIKIYPEREGFTKKILDLKNNDDIFVDNIYGNKIRYKGKGIFLAGGMGITPFFSILKSLDEKERKKNKLFWSNKNYEDVFLENEIKNLLGRKVKFILSQEKKKRFLHGRIDKEFLKKNVKNVDQYFYVCGKPFFVKDIKETLKEMGVAEEKIVSAS